MSTKAQDLIYGSTNIVLSGMIMPGEVKDVSIIIAVCGDSFCTFVADQRKVIWPELDKMEVVDEHFQKIFQINDHLIVGGTGRYYNHESILDAVGNAENTDAAYENICNYLKEHSDYGAQGLHRTYMVGGRNAKNESSLHLIWNTFAGGIESEPHVIPAWNSVVITKALTPKLPTEVLNEINHMMTLCVETSHNHTELVNNLEKIIFKVATMDASVNDNVSALTAF